ncbi:hypothetical protein [Phaeovulum sp. W22_SRMD_FR3]|uniref:hypothetical protein n=1 Tax=Phaeovulum sp. W22_SRMD_FR3 TaxID=3240274 RepID=UPI003F9BB9AF
MRVLAKVLTLSIPLFALAACDSSVAPSYQTSPQNTVALQPLAARGKHVIVASVTADSNVNLNPTCRLMGPLDIGGGQSTVAALKDAMTAELLAGGVYAANGTPLTITLTNLQVSSMEGYWLLAGTVQSPKMPGGFQVQSRFDYKTSFSAASACPNAAIAFNKAAAAFINAIVTNPQFASAI